MELNEMEKKLLFQVEGDYQTKILNELYMTVRYSNNSEQREAAEGLRVRLNGIPSLEVRVFTGRRAFCSKAASTAALSKLSPSFRAVMGFVRSGVR